MTPETETTFHYFWGMARSFRTDDLGLAEHLNANQRRIFSEDIEVLERQQRSIADNSDMKLRNLWIDSGGAHARRIINELVADESDQAP